MARYCSNVIVHDGRPLTWRWLMHQKHAWYAELSQQPLFAYLDIGYKVLSTIIGNEFWNLLGRCSIKTAILWSYTNWTFTYRLLAYLEKPKYFIKFQFRTSLLHLTEPLNHIGSMYNLYYKIQYMGVWQCTVVSSNLYVLCLSNSAGKSDWLVLDSVKLTLQTTQ